MEQEPKEPYVYQPEPAHKGDRIYGVAGPRTEKFRGLRFTKDEADHVVAELKRLVQT